MLYAILLTFFACLNFESLFFLWGSFYIENVKVHRSLKYEESFQERLKIFPGRLIFPGIADIQQHFLYILQIQIVGNNLLGNTIKQCRKW